MSRPTIWAPWRIEYIRRPKGDGCIFCRAVEADADRDNLVLTRGEKVFVILNRFPYTAGHMMVVPMRHVADPEDLELGEVTELWALFTRAKAALSQAFRPHGYNVGLNLGIAAGAGVADHLHLHVVPRWAGDTNFMPAVGEVAVISQHLADMYDSLTPCFRRSAGTAGE